MTNQELLDIFGSVKDEYILQAQSFRAGEKKQKVYKLPRRRMLLLAAVISLLLLLVGCAVTYVTLIYGSPVEMVAGLYGEHSAFQSAFPTEMNDPGKPGSSWTVPGYEKQPIEEAVAQELEKWVSPVGSSIAYGEYRLTVDAFIYDHVTQSGLITMLLEHSNPLTDEELGISYDGRICNLHGNYLNFNQYGWPYIIPEKTTDTQLAFTFYFQMDKRRGNSLIVSFPDFDENKMLDNLEDLRKEQIPLIRQRLMRELTVEEAAARCQQECGFSGYPEPYDDYYFLAANEFDTAHVTDYNTQYSDDLAVIEEKLKAELIPEEVILQLKEKWGQALFDETFQNLEQAEIAEIAYSVLAERTYEQTHTENKIYISLPEQMQLPNRTFGKGEVLVNSLCVQINSDRIFGEGNSPDVMILHFTDGTSVVVRNDEVDNTLFSKGIENGGVLYMLNSAINIDNIQSIEIVGDLSSETLMPDNSAS